MAEPGEGPHATGRITDALGVEPYAVSTTRAQLTGKGMVWSKRSDAEPGRLDRDVLDNCQVSVLADVGPPLSNRGQGIDRGRRS